MKKFNLFPIVLAAIGFFALVTFCWFGVGRVAVAHGNYQSIIGLFSTLGIDFKQVILTFPNWWGLIIMALIVIASICSGLLTRFHRGWYYVSTVLAAITAFIVFFYHKKILLMNDTNTIISVVRIGAGQIMSGSLLVIMAIGNVFAAYQDKQTA